MKLWLVEVHEDDWDYDYFRSGAVWADTPEQAEQIVRDAVRESGDEPGIDLPKGRENTRLVVKPAPESGIAHQHWHAG